VLLAAREVFQIKTPPIYWHETISLFRGKLMKLPFLVVIKDFFGLYALTPFEQSLLEHLKAALRSDDRKVLEYQLSHFTDVRRTIKPVSVPNVGGTIFYTIQRGENVREEKQKIKFSVQVPNMLLAIARVIFDGGEINIQFWIYKGVFFSIEYRSPQHVFYPENNYRIDFLKVWPESILANGKENISIEQAREIVDFYISNDNGEYRFYVTQCNDNSDILEQIDGSTKDFYSKYATLDSIAGELHFSMTEIQFSTDIPGFFSIGSYGGWKIIQRVDSDKVFVIEDEVMYESHDGCIDDYGYQSIYHLILEEIQGITLDYFHLR
jgi:hypothetical protein